MKKIDYKIPEKKRVRVFIDTDADCEADDHYAIVHALLTPKVEVRGIMAEHYSGRNPDEMEKSYQEIMKVCLLGGFDPTLALKGASSPMKSANDIVESEAVDALVAEAMSGDLRPLFVICQGALTNVASALLKEPEISKHMLLIIVGGINYPMGGYEFNTMNDIHAYNVVMNSKVPCWVVPEEVYSTMHVGMCEITSTLSECGDLGNYLVERTCDCVMKMYEIVPDFSEFNPYEYAVAFPNSESWSLGDSVGIGLLISHNSGVFDEVKAPNVNSDGSYTIGENAKKIRWYKTINNHFILDDFFFKMKVNYK